LSYGFETEIVVLVVHAYGRDLDLRGHSLIVLVAVPRGVGIVYSILL